MIRGGIRVLVALLAVAAVVAGVHFVPVWLFGVHDDEEQPDVAAIARSEPVTTARQASAALLDRELTEITTAAPWLDRLDDKVVDLCVSQPAGMFSVSWSPVVCRLTETRYFGFDGHAMDRAHALVAILTKTGWSVGISQDLSPDKGSHDEPTSPYEMPEVGASRDEGSPTAQHLGVKGTLRPKPFPAEPVIDYGGPPDHPYAFYPRVHQVDAVALSKRGFAHHKYLFALTVEQQYFDAEPPPPPATDPHPGYRPCYSGSNDCVGG